MYYMFLFKTLILLQTHEYYMLAACKVTYFFHYRYRLSIFSPNNINTYIYKIAKRYISFKNIKPVYSPRLP